MLYVAVLPLVGTASADPGGASSLADGCSMQQAERAPVILNPE